MSKVETVREQLADTSTFLGMYGGFIENYMLETVYEEAYATARAGEPLATVDTAQLTYLTAHFGTFVAIDVWGPDRNTLAGLVRERIGGPWKPINRNGRERADEDWMRDYRSIKVTVTTYKPVAAPTPAGE